MRALGGIRVGRGAVPGRARVSGGASVTRCLTLGVGRPGVMPRGAASPVLPFSVPPVAMAAVPIVARRRAARSMRSMIVRPRFRGSRRPRRPRPGLCAVICGRPLRGGVVAMRLLGPVLGRPAVTVLALLSQGLAPFLLEGVENPHRRDATYYPEATRGSSPAGRPDPGEQSRRGRGARLRAQPLCGGSARSGSAREAPAPLKGAGPRRIRDEDCPWAAMKPPRVRRCASLRGEIGAAGGKQLGPLYCGACRLSPGREANGSCSWSPRS